MTKSERAERDEALAKLREWIKPGDTVQTILRHVSRSGMQREISVVINRDGEVFNADYFVGAALGMRWGKHGGLVTQGCGIDMGFHIVHNLGYALFPDGFECIGEGDEHRRRCPSNDHSNGDRNYAPHHHDSGAYAIRHDWL